MQQADWSPRTGTRQRQTVAQGQLDVDKTCTPVAAGFESLLLANRFSSSLFKQQKIM